MAAERIQRTIDVGMIPRCLPKGIGRCRYSSFGLYLLPLSLWILLGNYAQGQNTENTLVSESPVLLQTIDASRNCTPAAIEQFPRPLMDGEMRRHGGFIIHLLVSVYMFAALAIVCDAYFVPALTALSEALNLKPDVAGATLMAAGSSAPELATSVIGVFIAKDDIGLGTVIGSAVFNIMFVISICGIAATSVITLNWWPLIRDCTFYLISVAILLVIIYDEKVEWFEALSLVLLYVVYCVFMHFNPTLERWSAKLNYAFDSGKQERTQLVSYDKVEETNLVEEVESGRLSSAEKSSAGFHTPDDLSMKLQENESLFKLPHGRWQKILWFLLLPLNLVCYVTIPDCRKTRWQNWFVVTFAMSLVWLAIYSYILVWMMTVLGFTFSIPDTVMGLTILAAGVSIPDAITSLIVVREGQGDMAVSNAVASNVFDILVCLGIPWLIRTAFVQPNSSVKVISKGLTYSTISLLSTVFFLLISVHLNKWRLDRRLGIILLVWYLFFMVLASLYELNVFGEFNPPTCPSYYE